MKNIFFILILSLGIKINSIGQINLVPNGDFEYFTTCPTNPGQINRAYPWYDPNNSTSDYYNACAPISSVINVPDYLNGMFQFAHSGFGYAGIFGWQAPSTNHREYIQIKLSDSLFLNSCYIVQFYCNLSNAEYYATNNLGAYLSQSAVTCPQYLPYYLTPQILLIGNPPIMDTLNWVRVQGVYTALGGEQYITIGNFQNDANTSYVIINGLSSNFESYYYIDDVSVIQMPNADAGIDTTICHGDSVQIGKENYVGVSYSWQPTTGLSNANIGNPKASPATTTTYYLTQTSPCGATSDTITVALGNCYIGVGEISDSKEINIAPNPATNELIITNEDLDIKEVKMYDVMGEIVNSQKATGNSVGVDLSGFAKGIYFIEVRTVRGVKRKRFVKE